MNKTYCIGDVHGCYYTLMALINKLPDNSRLIFLGDLCDKGNFTKEVYSFIIKNNHTVIKGNHDFMMEQYLQDAIKNNKQNIWTSKTWGGSKTVDSYKNDKDLIKEHLLYISTLPYYINLDYFSHNKKTKELEIKKYFLTHGFGAPYQENKDYKKLMSNRIGREYPDWEDFSEYKYINIFGHCDFDEVLIDKNNKYIGIDTGAVYGRKLTAIELNTHNIIQEDVHKEDI